MKVRTRFAPSPTGHMHVGGVRTALFAWLVAKQAGGQFILRIEDTDKAREVTGAENHIMESLSWLGLDWDEGPDKGGPSGPYRQSQRLETYKDWAQKLVAAGRAYADPYSPSELEGFRQRAKEAKKPFLFRDYRPQNPPEWTPGQPLRFKSEPKEYKWHDEVMGDLSAGPDAVDDFILIKSDGFPTYNFAHIVDDHLMQISHVIRSQEFTASVPRFLNLYDALGIEQPRLATVPYVMGPDGHKKLSKRDGAKDVLDYRNEGYLPAALVNFMASLGWNDGTEQELFTIDELVQKFSLERVQRSGARFDEKRLLWMDGHYIRQLQPDELYALTDKFWPPVAAGADREYKLAILKLVQERLKYLAELPGLTRFFFEEVKESQVMELFINPADKQLKAVDKTKITGLLEKAAETLSQSDFSKEDIASRLNSLLTEQATKPGILFAAVRIAVSGEPASPELFGTLSVLGKAKTVDRLRNAIRVLQNS